MLLLLLFSSSLSVSDSLDSKMLQSLILARFYRFSSILPLLNSYQFEMFTFKSSR